MLVVVLADGAADHHPCLEIQAAEHGIKNVAADIVEVDVDTFRAFTLEAFEDILGLVVNDAVEAQFVFQVLTFLFAPGDPHHPATFELGNLSGNAAHGTGGSGEHHGFTFLGSADVEQGEVGGHAGHAQGGQVARQRCQFRIDLVEALRLADEVVLHTEGTIDVVADGETGVFRGDHFADAQGAHDLAKSHWRNVRLALVHPAAHGRVQGQVEVFHLYLAFAGFTEW
ncbi:hypothetical protein D3C81_624570 [compost metagenome]